MPLVQKRLLVIPFALGFLYVLPFTLANAITRLTKHADKQYVFSTTVVSILRLIALIDSSQAEARYKAGILALASSADPEKFDTFWEYILAFIHVADSIMIWSNIEVNIAIFCGQ